MRTGLTNNRNVLTATTHRSTATPVYLQYPKYVAGVEHALHMAYKHLICKCKNSFAFTDFQFANLVAIFTNVEQSRIHESRCKVDKFELVITGEDGANGDLSMVAYGKDMNIVRRELKVHISHLCYILCTAAEDYYKNNKEKFDFIKYSIEDDRPKTFL